MGALRSACLIWSESGVRKTVVSRSIFDADDGPLLANLQGLDSMPQICTKSPLLLLDSPWLADILTAIADTTDHGRSPS